MFDKAKEFYQKHKKVIVIVAGGAVVVTAGVLLGKKLNLSKGKVGLPAGDLVDMTAASSTWQQTERAFLEGFGARYENGIDVPLVTKEIAINYLEKMGNAYQIDVFDLGEPTQQGVIWISKAVE